MEVERCASDLTDEHDRYVHVDVCCAVVACGETDWVTSQHTSSTEPMDMSMKIKGK